MKEKNFERKAELLEAALVEFTAKSYEDASLNAIIKNAGISKGTFYYHFADKQALYLFLLESSVKAKWDFINERTSENPTVSEEDNIFGKFRLQAKLGAEFALKEPKFHKLSRMLSKEQGTPIYRAALEYLGTDSEDALAGLIDPAIANGDFKSGYSREFLVKTLTYLFIGFHEIFRTEEDYELEQMLRNLDLYIEFMRNGIGS